MRKISLVALMLIILPVAQAADITFYNMEVVIDENILSETAEIFVDNPNLEDSLTLFLPPSISDLKASVTGAPIECSETEIVGFTEVICPTPLANYFIDLEFETAYPVVSVGERKLFSQDFNFGGNVDEFSLEVKLPERAVLPDELSQFVTPEPNKIGSDGRRIILSYSNTDISEYDVSIIYEPMSGSRLFAVWIFLGFVAAGLAILLLRKPKRKKRVNKQEQELHLLPDEKDVLNFIADADGPIRQKDIEKMVDFSKAKLSRVLRGLEERGVIRKIPKGNTNLIELVK